MTRTKGRMCAGKRRHATKEKALGAMWALIRRGAARARVNVYPCPHCGGYHVGHRERRR